MQARLAKFFRSMMTDVWEGHDPDGGEIQDLALKLGLIVERPYNPAVHGDRAAKEHGAEPGDSYFVIAPDLPQ